MAVTAGELVEVRGTYWTADNIPERGTVTFTPVLSAPMSGDPSRMVTQGKVTADLDEDGSFTVHLLASDDLGWQTDGPVLYRVVERLSCHVRSYLIAVPSDPRGTDISSLQPASDDPGTVVLPVQGPPGPAGPAGPGTVPDPWGYYRDEYPQWTPEQSWSKGDICFNDGHYWVIWYDAPSQVDDPLMEEPTVANNGGNAWFALNLMYLGYEMVGTGLTALDAGWGLNAAAGGRVSVPASEWEPITYNDGYLVRHQSVEFGPYYLYLSLESTGPTDVPGESPKWRLAYITDGTLGGLTDVDDSAWTAPAGKVLGTTAEGQWGPVDVLPQPPAPVSYTYNTGGVQTSGQTVILQGYLVVHETDGQGVDHDWGTVLHAGDKVTWGGQTYTVASINTGDANLPQVIVDNFVSNGLCLIKPVEPVPAAPANGAAVGFGPSWDGKALGVDGGVWGPVDPLAALKAAAAAASDFADFQARIAAL